MALPFRTFTDSTTLIQLLTASKISTADIGTLYNLAYREVVESYPWQSRKAEGVVATVAPYSTGTVTATSGSATLVGTSTVWTSAMVGRFARINSEDVILKITAFTDTTHVTLEAAWPLDTATDVTYEIFQYIYTVDATAGEVGTILTPTEGWPLDERSLSWVQWRDPAHRSAGGAPIAWIHHGVNSSGATQIEFWPRPESAAMIRVPYYKRVDDLSGASHPIVRSDVIEALATSYAFAHAYAKFGDMHYAKSEETWQRRFETRMEAAIKEDLERHNLPRSIQSERSADLDWDFFVRHDLD